MILTCSSCTTRFLVDAAAIGAAGRQVRCARCQHSWFQEPAGDLLRPTQGRATPVQPDPFRAGMRMSAAQAPKQPMPLRAGANLPALQPRPGMITPAMGWAVLVFFMAAMLGGGYSYRHQIAAAWPRAAKLYELIGLQGQAQKLRFEGIKFSRTMLADRPALLVQGVIVNEGDTEAAVPAVLIRLKDAEGREIFHWTHQLPAPRLAPGAKADFETIKADPPEAAQNLEVTFLPGG